VDGFRRDDIDQDGLGSYWFTAAASVLTLRTELITRVIPEDQGFDENRYTGLFHFRFWLFGEWYDVVIDDRLPWYKGKLVFCRNRQHPNELWAALLQKAYAKICGSYEGMTYGRITDGFIDMTGGIDETIPLKLPSASENHEEEIKQLLIHACEKKSLVGCSVKSSRGLDYLSGEKYYGIYAGYPLCVIEVKDLTTPTGVVTLVRCMSPWRLGSEWMGEWSNSCPLWDSVSEQEKRKFKFQRLAAGEFWISYEEFWDFFDQLHIFHFRTESMSEWNTSSSTTNSSTIEDSSWHEINFQGQWKVDESAGGRGSKDEPPEKYWLNPQHLIKFEVSTEMNPNKQCMMIVGLISEEQRKLAFHAKPKIAVRLDLYKVKETTDIQSHIDEERKFYMTQLEEVASSDSYPPCRSVTKRFTVSPGTYIIIPSTSKYNEEAEYFLRIFTDQKSDHMILKELKVNKETLTEEEIKRPIALAEAEAEIEEEKKRAAEMEAEEQKIRAEVEQLTAEQKEADEKEQEKPKENGDNSKNEEKKETPPVVTDKASVGMSAHGRKQECTIQ